MIIHNTISMKLRRFLTLPLILFLIVVFIIPLLKLLGISMDNEFVFDAYGSVLESQAYKSSFLNTVIISFTVAIFTLVLCVPIAYFLYKKNSKRISLLLVLLTLPLWISLLVRTFLSQLYCKNKVF